MKETKQKYDVLTETEPVAYCHKFEATRCFGIVRIEPFSFCGVPVSEQSHLDGFAKKGSINNIGDKCSCGLTICPKCKEICLRFHKS